MYAIYPFLKRGCVYVNSSDNSFYIGNSENAPVKLITELNIGDYETGGGGDEPPANPEWPALKDLTVGNTITWASKQWIVSHKTADTCYLTLNGLANDSTWHNLQSNCTRFASQLTEKQKECLKSVTAGNTSGKVFVATEAQMNGGFSYFNSNSRRSLGTNYWTSTRKDADDGRFVYPDGSINSFDKSYSYGFRPSVCIDLTKYTVS